MYNLQICRFACLRVLSSSYCSECVLAREVNSRHALDKIVRYLRTRLILPFPYISISLARLTLSRSVIFSSCGYAVSTLFIHPRNSQPEGAHRPETHTRMWPLLLAFAPPLSPPSHPARYSFPILSFSSLPLPHSQSRPHRSTNHISRPLARPCFKLQKISTGRNKCTCTGQKRRLVCFSISVNSHSVFFNSLI